MENSNNEKWYGWGHVVSNEQKNIEELAEEKYPYKNIKGLTTGTMAIFNHQMDELRLAFIAGHTTKVEGMVKKDEVKLKIIGMRLGLDYILDDSTLKKYQVVAIKAKIEVLTELLTQINKL